jgi:hypothetical protein
MKSFDLESMGVHEMNALEMQETDGGILLALAAIAVVGLLCSGCIQNNNTSVIIGSGSSSRQSTVQDNDSTMNGNLNGNRLELSPLDK